MRIERNLMSDRSMKSATLILSAAVLSTVPLFGVELRETQFPAKPEAVIIVAGTNRPSGECLKPWAATDPGEYAGTYDSRTITDGRARLTLKLHQAKSRSGEIRWCVNGTLETRVGTGVTHLVTFKNAELQEPKQPCFDVIDRLIPGLFVLFTEPESKGAKPKRAVVIGNNVFVLEKDLKPGS
jgi:hypothetical protein